MIYRVRIEVKLKPGHSDPEGETTADLLTQLGYEVKAVNISKVYTIQLDVRSKNEAKDEADEICKRLLANPTKDDYSVFVEEEE